MNPAYSQPINLVFLHSYLCRNAFKDV